MMVGLAIFIALTVFTLHERRLGLSQNKIRDPEPGQSPGETGEHDAAPLEKLPYASGANVDSATIVPQAESPVPVPAFEAKPATRVTRRVPALGPEQIPSQVSDPHLPVVFLPLPSGRNWNADDAEAVGALARQFTESVVGPSQSSTDPAYYQRWINQERIVNEQYRSYFGSDAFNGVRNPED